MDHACMFGWISSLRFDTDVRNLILGYDQGVMSGIIGADNQVDPSMFQTDIVVWPGFQSPRPESPGNDCCDL